jgi:hypothetical protein
MSDEQPASENDPLMAEVSEMMQGIDDQISIEKILTIATRITVNLEAYRKLMQAQTGFSDEWIEACCLRVFNTFFRNGS